MSGLMEKAVYRDEKTKSTSRQKGMVTIFMILVLMLVMSLLALTAGKEAVIEQQTSGADYRAQEAAEAISGSLEFALSALNASCCSLSGSVLTIATTGGFSYSPTVSVTTEGNYVDVKVALAGSSSTDSSEGKEQMYAAIKSGGGIERVPGTWRDW